MRIKDYSIEFPLSRTFIYGVLMALLAAIYFSCDWALQQIFLMLLGDSLLIVVGASLLTTALLKPVEHRVQILIDRRFLRYRYDAAQTVATFSASVRYENDLPELAARLEQVIVETLHPTHVLTWLNTPNGYALYLFAATPALWSMAEVPPTDPLVIYCLARGEVIDLTKTTLDSPALQMLRGARIKLVAPLLTHEELIGWLGLGARASAQKYSLADLRLLNTLAAQVTPALRVAQMVAVERIGMPRQ
ncbi:MAG: GAF domain-containing protein [Caldilineaceae bacterium]